MTSLQTRPPANRWNRIRAGSWVTLVVVAVSAISACVAGRSKEGTAATNNIDRPPSDQAKSTATANNDNLSVNSTVPKRAEVEAALARVYQDTVTIDSARSEPSLVGDFNGDGSQDLAVIVRPGGEGAL